MAQTNHTYLTSFWRHPWTCAACNLLIVLTLFSVSRLFYYYISQDLYADITPAHLLELMKGGIRFDLTAVLYLSSAYLLMQLLPLKTRHAHTYANITYYLFVIPNTIGLIVNSMDMVYSHFSGKRTTLTFFAEFVHDDNLLNILLQAIVQYWYVTIFAVIIVLLLIFLTRKNKPHTTRCTPLYYYIRETVILLLSVYFIVIGIRGGFGAYTRPITLSNALEYTNRPLETNIVLNTPFCLMRSAEGGQYTHPHYMSNEEMERLYSPIHTPDSNMVPNHKNVVVIILESFSKEYIGYYNHDLENGTYQGYTPFLDSLLAHSITYDVSISSGRKSIDAMPCILSAIPRIGEPYILTPYSTNQVQSIASCLGEIGYQTAFFHGAPNGSMGFKAYARACGFDQYIGMDEYNQLYPDNNDFDGTWAIWDEEFLAYYALCMNQMKEPFATAVFTASSHHPFRVPQRYENVFKQGTLPIHPCIGYTDHALRIFFDTIKKEKWFDNTLFVITADHTNALQYPKYQNDKGIYEVPIAFYDPSWSEEERRNRKTFTHQPVSHTDIMPSVLSYLQYNKPYIAFGDDVLNQTKKYPMAFGYNEPVVQVLTNEELIQFDGQHISAAYQYKIDPYIKHKNATPTNDSIELIIQAYVQQYMERMIEDRLRIGDW